MGYAWLFGRDLGWAPLYFPFRAFPLWVTFLAPSIQIGGTSPFNLDLRVTLLPLGQVLEGSKAPHFTQAGTKGDFGNLPWGPQG